jgi:hypothetical protein
MKLFIITALTVLLVTAPLTALHSGQPSYSFKFSGFFKGDAIYDQTRTSHGNFSMWVNPYGDTKDNTLNITARETRLGLNFWWDSDEIRTDARLEFDFYGLGAAPGGYNSMENKAAPMLRHAYLKLTKGKVSILAGQTSDVISPLVPKTVNYTVAWGQGNIGYRRPQFRLTTWTDIAEKATIKFDLAAARNLGSDLDNAEIDAGTDAAIPVVQGRLGFCSEFSEEGKVSLGVSGHYGQEKFGTEDSLDVESWSFNADANVAITSKIHLSGEYFAGQNLGTYMGGILQSTNPQNSEIASMGGWGMLSVKPVCSLTLNAGYSFEDPDDADFLLPQTISPATPDPVLFNFRDKNTMIFGNLMYEITDNVTGMLEIAYLKTEYISKNCQYSYPDGEFVLSETEKDEFDDFQVRFALKAAIK